MSMYNTLKKAVLLTVGALLTMYALGSDCIATPKTLVYRGSSQAQQTLAVLDDKVKQHLKKLSERNGVEKYAVLVSGNSEKYERGLKNRFWLALTDIYPSLLKQGFKKENIHILYPLPPNKELPRNHDISDYILSEENKKNIAWSSKENLQSILESLAKKVNSNDILVLYFTGYLNSENGKSNYHMLERTTPYSRPQSLTNEELNVLLNKFDNKSSLAVFDTCPYGKKGRLELDNPNFVSVYTRRNKDKYCVLLPDFSLGVLLFKNLSDKKSDGNKDGEVSIQEAFKRSMFQYKQQIKEWSKQGLITEKDKNNLPYPIIRSKKISPAKMHLD